MATTFYSSVTTALLPPLAAYLKRDESQKVLENLLASMKLVTIVSVPAVVLIVVLREPLVAVLFQRGQVDQVGLTLAASVVAVYALSLFLMGHWRVLQNFFYADATPRVVTWLFLLTAVLNLALDLLLVQVWQAQGIAAATLGSTGVATLAGFVLLHRRLGGFPWAQLAPFLARTCAASLASLGGIFLGERAGVISLAATGDLWRDLYNLGVGGAIGGLPFVAIFALSEAKLLAVLRFRAPLRQGAPGQRP